MNLKYLPFILAVLFLSGCATSQKEIKKSNATIQQLDALDKEERKIALFEKLLNDLPSINSANQIKPYLDWLQKKVLFSGETFRYSTLYAFYLWKVQKKESAEAIMLHAQLRLETDFSRCKNKSNSLSKYTGWYQGGKIGSQILESYKRRDSKNKKLSFTLAFALEKKQKNRPGDLWLCSSINWVKAMKQYDKLKKKDTSGGSTHLGKTIEVEATKNILLEASFVPDKIWLDNRTKILKKFREKYE